MAYQNRINNKIQLEYIALVVSSIIGIIVADEELHNVRSNWSEICTIKQKRVDADEIFEKLDPTYSNRACRMKELSSWKL